MSVRGGWSFWIGLSACYLAGFGWLSHLAPCGFWVNQVFGHPMWVENDPGGFYVVNAHELFQARTPFYWPGHPGLPLDLLLWTVQAALYGLSGGAGTGLTFTQFTARQISVVFTASKILITAVHLTSFLLLHRLARRLGSSPRAAVIAVLLYATSLPVLYYASRISVEPVMMTLFLATLVCLLEASRDERHAARWAALAGVAAVSAAFTKAHLMAFLPLLAWLFVRLRSDGGDRASRRRAGLWLIGAAGLATAAFLPLADWWNFGRYWLGVAGVDTAGGTRAVAGATGTRLVEVAAGILDTPLRGWLPGPTRAGLFLLCEPGFVALGLAGAAVWWRRREPPRRLVGWLLLFCSPSLLVWLFRVGYGAECSFHYLFAVMAILAITAGVVVDLLLRRLLPSPSTLGNWAVTLGVCLAVHAVSLVAVGGSRLHDVAEFRRLALYHQVLHSLGPGERIGIVVGAKPVIPPYIHGLEDFASRPAARSRLNREMDSLLALVPVAGLARPAVRQALIRAGVHTLIDARSPDHPLGPIPLSAPSQP